MAKTTKSKKVKQVKPKMVRTMFEDEQYEYKNGGSLDDTPKVYIADLAAYNEGKLVGEWIDLSDYNDGSEVMDEISNLLKKWSKKAGEEREEYAVHDYENFASNLYSEYMGEESFDKVIKAYKVSEEKGIPADVIGTIMREYNPDDIEEWIDEHYEGQFDNDTDLAYHYVDIVGGEENLDTKTLKQYFDYERFGRDLAYDYNDYSGYYFRTYAKGGNIKKHDLTMYVFKNTSAYTIGGL
jgi:antirestriction protein